MFFGGGDRVLIDDWMPSYDFVERHAVEVRAPAAHVYEALFAVDFGKLLAVRLLLGLRMIPALLLAPRKTLGRLRRDGRVELGMRTVLSREFALLAEEPPEGIVLGITGRFWRPSGLVLPTDPATFREAPAPGTARAAWSFTVAPGGDGGATLATETRIRCGDAAARRSFGRYWRLVRPGSGLIRLLILRAVRRQAEAAKSDWDGEGPAR